MRNRPLGLLVALALFDSLTHSACTVTFNVTPSAVSNTDDGTLSLFIGSLTKGETVVVQKLLDANTNSVQQLLSPIGSSMAPVVGLTTSKMENGQFEFTFNTMSGVNYTAQYCTTLGNWIDLMTLGGLNGPLTMIDHNPADSGECFYRVKTGP